MDTKPSIPDTPLDYPRQEAVTQVRRFISQVYSWMTIALLTTGLVALYTASSAPLLHAIFNNPSIFFILLIAEVGLVILLSARIGKLSPGAATAIFMLYSVLNGLTLSFIFLAYTSASIASAFFITAGTFAAMSLLGYFTKTDLTRFGSILYMALIGLIIASVVNLIWYSDTIYWITTYAGVLIFTGLTAYDTQKIKQMGMAGYGSGETERKAAVMGALSLYLDFINLFLFLLRLFGRRQ